jgi:Protein of unknown function (DUF1214)
MKKIMAHLTQLASVLALLPAAPVFAEDTAAVAAQEWRTYVEPLGPVGERLLAQSPNPQDAQLRRELYREIFAQISNAYIGLLHADAQHPDFWPYLNEAYRFAGPNPDNSYYATPLDDTGVYKISGFRGTVKRVDFQIGTGTFFPRGVLDEHKLGLTLSNYDLDSLPLKKDGSFEVILSPTRPEGYKGNWWKLLPKASYLLLRQISYDWLHEVDGRFAIERLDQAAIKPRPTAAELEEDLQQIAKWAEGTVALSINFAKGIRLQQGINKITYKDLSEYGAIVTQRYAFGGFDLAPDEALIVEAKVPTQCRYWSIHLLDDIGFTLDWMHRQTNLNGYTAKIDKDGVFRAVISARDPGVPNWLDNAGYQSGAIQVRWEMCSTWPEHKVTKVKTDEVRKYLPADTPVITAAVRDAAIRLRRKGAQMRKRW